MRVVARCILSDLDGTLYTSAGYSDRLELEILEYVPEKLQMPRTIRREEPSREKRRLKPQEEDWFHRANPDPAPNVNL